MKTLGIYCDECNVWMSRQRGEPCVCNDCLSLIKSWEGWGTKQREEWLFQKVKEIDRSIRNALQLDVDILKGLVENMRRQLEKPKEEA